jgi:hypothetical protein
MKSLFKTAQCLAAAGVGLMFGSAALAQAPAQTVGQAPAGAGAGPDVMFYEKIGPGPVLAGGGIGLVRFEGLVDQKVVTGAPFTATISQETSQTLADGNRIERNATGTFARDSEGRTRRDMALPAIGPWAASGKEPPHAIFINDPVAGTRYVLDATEKVAHQMPPGPPEPKIRPHPDTGAAMEIQQEETTVSLGTQTINGISAEGTRTVRTIPAGEIGNQKPITITVERWYSNDLQTYVLIKHSDPMMGDTVYQLTNIQRTEPDASLFQVPADYTIKQGRGMEFHVTGPPPPQPPSDNPDAQ